MVDFESLVGKEEQLDISTLLALFESLDVETTHTELRPAQREALEALTSRIEAKDNILKISTGAGKTTIGLLYLKFLMIKHKEPAVYLCPTVQLVNQVIRESRKLGIESHSYPSGQQQPHYKCSSGDAILVCTYDKLFNALSTFNRDEVQLRPCAVVLDDAHNGIEKVKKSFTFSINSTHGDLHKTMMSQLKNPCEKINPSTWQLIESQDPMGSMEVPYWEWKSLVPEFLKEITKYKKDLTQVRLVWPHLTDILRYCRCIVSGSGIEIIPEIIPIHNCPAFHESPHRLFMSATLADDSVLIRQLGCSEDAARNPLLPESDRGLGERMVLAPSLIHCSLDRNWIMQKCKDWAKKYNVVVLSPNEPAAKQWETVGASVCLGNNVEPKVAELKTPNNPTEIVTFAQRYDGIDLPDRAARILIIDGLPKGEAISDKFDAGLSTTGTTPQSHLVYRIEQGMGRAVRSHADYAVVILAGHNVAHFVVKKDVQELMTPDTREQIRLGINLVEHAITSEVESQEEINSRAGAVIDMVSKCLGRDSGWKQFYDKNVRKKTLKRLPTDDNSIKLAVAERTAFNLALGNDSGKASEAVRGVVNATNPDAPLKGAILQKAANYLFDVDEAKALELQAAAYKENTKLMPAPGIVFRPISLSESEVQTNVLAWVQSFDNLNGTIAYLTSLKSRLNLELHYKRVESALKDLAEPLGAIGTRPETTFGKGPDVMWNWIDFDLVIEAKNENKKSLHKKDAGQLSIAINWHSESYPERSNKIPVVVAKVSELDHNATFPDGTLILGQVELNNIMDALEKFYRELAAKLPQNQQVGLVKELMNRYSLLPEQFLKKYLRDIRKK